MKPEELEIIARDKETGELYPVVTIRYIEKMVECIEERKEEWTCGCPSHMFAFFFDKCELIVKAKGVEIE